MKNNLLTTNPEEIAKQYLQPQVSNLDGLTVYGGKRLTAPIMFFVRGCDLKLSVAISDWINESHSENPTTYEVYTIGNNKESNVSAVLIDNKPTSDFQKTANSGKLITLNGEDQKTHCVQIYGKLDSSEEYEYYNYNTLNYIESNRIGNQREDILCWLPPNSVVILPPYLDYIPKSVNGRGMLTYEFTNSNYNTAVEMIETVDSECNSKEDFISKYYPDNLDVGEYQWSLYQYLKQNLGTYEEQKPIVYITGNTLPTIQDSYVLKDVKVKFLNSMLALQAKVNQYWSDLDIEGGNNEEFVKYLLSTYSSTDTITVFYNVTTTSSSTLLNRIGQSGYSTPASYFTGMYIDGVEVEIAQSYTFSTTGLHTVQYKYTSSCTELTIMFMNVNFVGIIIPSQLTTSDSYLFYNNSNRQSCSFCINLSQINFPANSFTDRAISDFLLLSNSTPGNVLTTGLQSTTTIYVPASAVNTYKTATGWSTYANQIKAIPE